MIIISREHHTRYGCPICGNISSLVRGYKILASTRNNTEKVQCSSYKNNYVILEDGLNKSPFGTGNNLVHSFVQIHPLIQEEIIFSKKILHIEPFSESFDSKKGSMLALFGNISSIESGQNIKKMFKRGVKISFDSSAKYLQLVKIFVSDNKNSQKLLLYIADRIEQNDNKISKSFLDLIISEYNKGVP